MERLIIILLMIPAVVFATHLEAPLSDKGHKIVLTDVPCVSHDGHYAWAKIISGLILEGCWMLDEKNDDLVRIDWHMHEDDTVIALKRFIQKSD